MIALAKLDSETLIVISSPVIKKLELPENVRIDEGHIPHNLTSDDQYVCVSLHECVMQLRRSACVQEGTGVCAVC